MEKYHYGVLTVSDSCSAGTSEDLSGKLLIQLIESNFHVTATNNIKYELISDDSLKIESTLRYFCDVHKLAVIFTTGGTGFSKRDNTPEATKNVITKEAPQLALVITLKSLEKTKFAALSRGICGIRGDSLILNFPGSKKAVGECFSSILELLPHAVELIRNELTNVKLTHSQLPISDQPMDAVSFHQDDHVCPHKCKVDEHDRNSIYPMIEVDVALDIILSNIKRIPRESVQTTSPISNPPFNASIKDGYAVKALGGSGLKNVVCYVAAGDPIYTNDFSYNQCIKINTGAPIPKYADAIIQIEDTRLHEIEDNSEKVVEILIEPKAGLDIRIAGSDLAIGDKLFDGNPPFTVAEKSILASVGLILPTEPKISIAIISTGDELSAPGQVLPPGHIYDSNTTMLGLLIEQFGFTVKLSMIAKDDYKLLKKTIADCSEQCDVTICSGGVSMGDKDFVKPVLEDLGYEIKFGRVNMKPGKPTTFGYNKENNKSFFGLPGNPVSAFVTFHLFVLPTLRHLFGFTDKMKCKLPEIIVELLNDQVKLDPRPEYARASIISKDGKLFAKITGDQISSRIKSVVGADVLLQLPPGTLLQKTVSKGTKLKALILKHDFISEYH